LEGRFLGVEDFDMGDPDLCGLLWVTPLEGLRIDGTLLNQRMKIADIKVISIR
jgi:hypothetical protein